MTTTDISSAFEKYKQDHRLPGNTIWRVAVKGKHGHVGIPHFADFEAAYAFFCAAQTLDDVTALNLSVLDGRGIAVDLAAWEREAVAPLDGLRLAQELALFGARLAVPDEEHTAIVRRMHPYNVALTENVTVRWDDTWLGWRVNNGSYINHDHIRRCVGSSEHEAKLTKYLIDTIGISPEDAVPLTDALVNDEMTYQAAIARKVALDKKAALIARGGGL